MERYTRIGVVLHDAAADATARDFARLLAGLARRSEVVELPATGERDAIRAAERSGPPDLLVVGRRAPLADDAAGFDAARLAKKAHCDVLVTVAEAPVRIERLLVATDLSPASRLALEVGLALADAVGDPPVSVNVLADWPVGYGFGKLGLSHSEAVAQREATLRQRLAEFVADAPVHGRRIELVPATRECPEQAIAHAAVAGRADLVIFADTPGVAVAGEPAISGVLAHVALPVLVVRPKAENPSLLDALFGTG